MEKQIKILAEFTVSDENRTKAFLFFRGLAEGSISEEGCLEYSVAQDSKNLNCFIIHEVFTDNEAFEFHKTTKHFTEILKGELEPLIINKHVRFLI
jgi:quinol monooxygenase YgiN